MIVFLTGTAVIFAGGLLALVVPSSIKRFTAASGAVIGAVICSVPALRTILYSGFFSAKFHFRFPIGELLLLIDPLSGFFIVLACTGAILASVYGFGSLEKYEKEGKNLSGHLFFFNLLVCAILFVFVSQNIVFFLIVWEIMSLSSVFMVLFNNNNSETLKSAVYYAVAMHISVIFLITGFLLIFVTGSGLSFKGMILAFGQRDRLAFVSFAFLVTGFAIKSGFVPFHGWLPRTYTAVPGHAAGFMSGVMSKTGIYGILRFVLLTETPPFSVSVTLLSLAVLSALYGALSALTARDIKRLVSFSSIENIGLIGIGVGVGMIASTMGNYTVSLFCYSGALILAFSHMLAKSTLFMTTETVSTTTGIRDMERLGGLVKKIPVTAFSAFGSSAAILALPPFGGFAGLFIVLTGLIAFIPFATTTGTVMIIMVIAAIGLSGGMAIVAFTKYFGITFLGLPRSASSDMAHEKHRVVRMVPLAGLFLVFLTGLFPQYVFMIVIRVSKIITRTPDISPEFITQTGNNLKGLSIGSASFILLVFLLLGIRKFLLKGRTVTRTRTWDCGYGSVSPRIQYTGYSFVQPFLSITGRFSGVRKERTLPRGIFPSLARFSSKRRDHLENIVVGKPLQFIDRIFNRIYTLQTGKVQIYILYGFLFLAISLIWVLMGGK